MAHGYHITVHTSDSAGSMWFAGGPTSHLNSNPRAGQDGVSPTPWGFLWGSSDREDSVPDGPDTRVVVDDGKPCTCYNNSFNSTINTVNSQNIFYSPLVQNSNSLAGTMLSNAGINAPATWGFWTPAYNNNLNNYIPLAPFSDLPYPVK
jgi:hypothetical protein